MSFCRSGEMETAFGQQLESAGRATANGAAPRSEASVDVRSPEINFRNLVTVGVLNFINLLNYIDRYTLAGVLDDVIRYYNISHASAGLIQTSFVLSYMILAPIFGYFGDRFNRKYIMLFGIAFWAGTTLAGSFVPSDMFPLFLFLRMTVGVGEASYSTIAPTVIADLFTGKRRTLMLTVFYFAIPIGSGLGFVIGSSLAKIFNDWKYALRFTPIGGAISCLLLLFLVREPARGEMEGPAEEKRGSYSEDLRDLARNRTYVLSTLGFTGVTFVTGAIAYWAPYFTEYAYWTLGVVPNNTAFLFGVVTMATGLAGVVAGSAWASRWRRTNPGADALVCGIGVLTAGPLLFVALLAAERNMVAFWATVVVAELALCLNWALVADILLYVVPPQNRSTAEAVQILLSHALGDAGSPYLVGVLSDSLKPEERPGVETFRGLFIGVQYALLMTCFVAVIGGLLFLLASLYLPEDKKKVEMMTKLNAALQEIVDIHEEQQQEELLRQKLDAAESAKRRRLRGDGAILVRYSPTLPSSFDNFGYNADLSELDTREAKAIALVRPPSVKT